MHRSFARILFLCALPPYIASAQPATPSAGTEPVRFAGSHAIELSVGLLHSGSSSVTISAGTVSSGVSERGVLGSLRYAYWVEDDLALQVSAGVLNADATTTVSGGAVSAESASVIPVLFGLKFQPFAFREGSGLRPYLYGSLGPCIGYSSGVQAGATTASTVRWEMAMGARLAAGLDFLLRRLLTIGLQMGYLGMIDFENAIGGRRNYSGPELSLSIALTLGR